MHVLLRHKDPGYAIMIDHHNKKQDHYKLVVFNVSVFSVILSVVVRGV